MDILTRAKGYGSGGKYQIGFESDLDGEYGITDLDGYYWECEKNTRAIHLKGMFDKNGQKLFASLDMKTKKGGDICLIKDNKGNIRESVLVWHKYALCIDNELINIIEDNDNFTGISPQQFKYYLEVKGIYE